MPDAITSVVWAKCEYSKIYFLKSQLTSCGWEVEMAPPPTSQPNNPFRGRRTSILLWCKTSDMTSWNYTNKSRTGTEIKHAAISIPRLNTQLDWCLQQWFQTRPNNVARDTNTLTTAIATDLFYCQLCCTRKSLISASDYVLTLIHNQQLQQLV